MFGRDFDHASAVCYIQISGSPTAFQKRSKIVVRVRAELACDMPPEQHLWVDRTDSTFRRNSCCREARPIAAGCQ